MKDMKNLKIWIPEGDQMAYGAMNALGISPVTMPLTDVLTGLQTELIDTIMGPPAATIILQWNTGVNYITDLPLGYVYAMLVIEKKYFQRLEPNDQTLFRDVMEKVYQGFDHQGMMDNEEAYKALLSNGLKPITPNQGEVNIWRSKIRESNHSLAEKGIVDVAILDEIECYVEAYRQQDLSKDCSP